MLQLNWFPSIMNHFFIKLSMSIQFLIQFLPPFFRITYYSQLIRVVHETLQWEKHRDKLARNVKNQTILCMYTLLYSKLSICLSLSLSLHFLHHKRIILSLFVQSPYIFQYRLSIILSRIDTRLLLFFFFISNEREWGEGRRVEGSSTQIYFQTSF